VPIQQAQYELGTAGTRSDAAVQVAKEAINVLRGRAPSTGPAVLDRKSALCKRSSGDLPNDRYGSRPLPSLSVYQPRLGLFIPGTL
jgi:hypothetical protein